MRVWQKVENVSDKRDKKGWNIRKSMTDTYLEGAPGQPYRDDDRYH